MGGLPGLICTVADAGSKGVKLFGPRGLKGAICAMRPFLIRPDFDLQINEIDHQEWIKDGDIKVKAILRKGVEEDNVNMSTDQEDLILSRMFPKNNDVAQLRQNPYANDIVEHHTSSYDHPQILGLVISGPKKPGKFDVEAAKALGIPAGPLYGRLQKGLPVELEGRIIYPEQCVGKPNPTPVLLYLQEHHIPLPQLDADQQLVAVIHDYKDPKPFNQNDLLEFVYPESDSLERVMVDSYMQCRELYATDDGFGVPIARKARYACMFTPIKPLMKLHVIPNVEIERERV